MDAITKITNVKHKADSIHVEKSGDRYIAEVRYSSGVRWAWAFGESEHDAINNLAACFA